MSDQMNTIFTSEEILQLAQVNFNAICLVMTAYLKDKAMPIDG